MRGIDRRLVLAADPQRRNDDVDDEGGADLEWRGALAATASQQPSREEEESQA